MYVNHDRIYKWARILTDKNPPKTLVNLSPNKWYYIIQHENESGSLGIPFYIVDNDQKYKMCLEHYCAYLNNGDWELSKDLEKPKY